MEKTLLATVGDLEITKDQMIAILRNLPREQAQSVAGEEGRARLLDEMIAAELLYLEAKKNKLDETEEFHQIVEETKHTLLQRYAVNKLFETIEISDESVEKQYADHRDQYAEPEKAVAKHILVDSEEKAEDIKKELEEGKAFEDAAKEYSTCPSKERGGDLGAFSRGQMVKEFEDAAFTADVNKVVGPVKTQFGYHLIKVSEITPASVLPLDQVKDTIKNQLMQQKQSEVYLGKIDELKGTYPIKVNPEGLK